MSAGAVIRPVLLDNPSATHIMVSMSGNTKASASPPLPEGWSALDPENAGRLAERLALEMSADHLLTGVAVEAIASRHANDDVLYRHISDRSRYTVVHLTWGSRRETRPNFPSVEFDGTFEEFLESERHLERDRNR